MNIGGERSTSTAFELFSSLDSQPIGENSFGAFISRSGFIYFPVVSSPVVSATAGDSQVSLSWSAAVGALGWVVSGYNVGQSTTAGGPYTFSASLGSDTSSTRTGLTNGTTYYFVVRAEDAFGNFIATSTETSATPVAATPAPTPASSSGNSGGGGGYITPSGTSDVIFSGRAYPLSTVVLLKDAQIAVSTIAGPDSNFQISLTGLSAGSYTFSLYGQDKNGLRSTLFTFSVTLTAGAATNVGGIFVAPTISADKIEVKKGNDISIFGQTASQSEVTIIVNSDKEYFAKTRSDKNGVYLYNFDTSPLDLGNHSTKSKSAINGSASSFSSIILFKVGMENVLASKRVDQIILKGDVDGGGRVNLVDFSIIAYWYQRPSPPSKVDLNGDGEVDLVDFSIMAYYWTG